MKMCVCVGCLEFMHTYIKHHYAKSCSAMLWVNCMGLATVSEALTSFIGMAAVTRSH